MGLPKRMVGWFNGGVVRLRSSPRWGRMIRNRLTVITYTGRRSGRTFSTPVSYRRVANTVLIGVQFPDAKTWWRNFEADGGPITLDLDGTSHTGHATARRHSRNRVNVTVELTD